MADSTTLAPPPPASRATTCNTLILGSVGAGGSWVASTGAGAAGQQVIGVPLRDVVIVFPHPLARRARSILRFLRLSADRSTMDP